MITAAFFFVVVVVVVVVVFWFFIISDYGGRAFSLFSLSFFFAMPPGCRSIIQRHFIVVALFLKKFGNVARPLKLIFFLLCWKKAQRETLFSIKSTTF